MVLISPHPRSCCCPRPWGYTWPPSPGPSWNGRTWSLCQQIILSFCYPGKWSPICLTLDPSSPVPSRLSCAWPAWMCLAKIWTPPSWHPHPSCCFPCLSQRTSPSPSWPCSLPSSWACSVDMLETLLIIMTFTSNKSSSWQSILPLQCEPGCSFCISSFCLLVFSDCIFLVFVASSLSILLPWVLYPFPCRSSPTSFPWPARCPLRAPS